MSSKARGATSWGQRSYNKDNRDGGWSSKGKFGGNKGSFGGGWQNRMDPAAKLKFSETIKIDPEVKAPITDMKFSPQTLKILEEKKFTQMTPVQTASYDPVFNGKDVVARSRTGTGKTFAFGLPIIEKLIANGIGEKRMVNGLPLVLIMEPTRELAMQVAQELSGFCAIHRLRITAIYGGVSFSMQEKIIRSGVHILVATPGRALDHISRGTLDLSNCQHVVLDEGDTMLEMGFQKSVESIIANVKTPGEKARRAAAESLLDGYDGDAPRSDNSGYQSKSKNYDLDEIVSDEDDTPERNVQMLLFSATMPGWICRLTDKHMKNPIFLDAVQEGENRLASTITHYAIKLPPFEDRISSVSAYIEDLILTKSLGGQTIVFTNTKDEADTLIGTDCFGQLKCQVLHGDIGQHSRQITIKQFKEGSIEVLVATDVAARGLDIAGVELVVHTAPPGDFDTYVHRSGRTGRAGRNGTSVLLFSAAEERKLSTYENALNFKFQRAGPPSPQQISEASAVYATKKLEKVDDDAVEYFIPYAQSLIRDLHDEEEIDAKEDMVYSSEKVEELMARCLAAISNKNSISCRSILSGSQNTMTLQVNAVFKNGTSPGLIRDWQKLFAGVLKRTLDMDNVKFGKTVMAKDKNRQMIALIDVPYESGRDIMQKLQTVSLPQGVNIQPCESLPSVVISDRPEYTSYGNDNYRSSSSGGGGGGSGRSWGGNKGDRGGDRDRRGSYGGSKSDRRW